MKWDSSEAGVRGKQASVLSPPSAFSPHTQKKAANTRVRKKIHKTALEEKQTIDDQAGLLLWNWGRLALVWVDSLTEDSCDPLV